MCLRFGVQRKHHRECGEFCLESRDWSPGQVLQPSGGVGWAGFLTPAFPSCFGTSQNPKVIDKGFGPGVCLFILGQSPEGQLGVKVEITGDGGGGQSGCAQEGRTAALNQGLRVQNCFLSDCDDVEPSVSKCGPQTDEPASQGHGPHASFWVLLEATQMGFHLHRRTEGGHSRG